MIKTEKLVYGSANSSVQFEGSISYEDSFDTPRPWSWCIKTIFITY